MRRALLACLVALPALGPAPAPAQPPADEGPSLHVYFDRTQRTREQAAEVGQPVAFTVVARGAHEGVRGFEFSLELDPRLRLVDREHAGINVAQGDGFLVGIPPEECLRGPELELLRGQLVLVEEGATDLVIGLSAYGQSSFDPPSPGYLFCAEDELRAFSWPDTAAVLNPATVRLPAGAPDAVRGLLEMPKGR